MPILNLVVRVIHLIVRYHLTWSHANLYGDHMPPLLTLSRADLQRDRAAP